LSKKSTLGLTLPPVDRLKREKIYHGTNDAEHQKDSWEETHPLGGRPNSPLAITLLLIVGFGILLPFMPLATPPGFTPLLDLSFLFLVRMGSASLLLFEVGKRWLMRRSFAVP